MFLQLSIFPWKYSGTSLTQITKGPQIKFDLYKDALWLYTWVYTWKRLEITYQPKPITFYLNKDDSDTSLLSTTFKNTDAQYPEKIMFGHAF